ncbi:hypothetical protein MRY87_12820 [bacterium]|nr:hypothetical protein [bacterium]
MAMRKRATQVRKGSGTRAEDAAASSGDVSSKNGVPENDVPREGPASHRTPNGSEDISLVEQAIAEDPLARFFRDQWRPLLIGAALIALVFYGRALFEETRFESLRRSADILLDLQTQVAELEQSLPALKAEAEQEASSSATAPDAGTSDAGGSEDGSSSSEESGGEAEGGVSTPQRDSFRQGVSRAQELTRALAQERSPYRELSRFYARVISLLEAKMRTVSGEDASESLSVAPSEGGEIGEGELGLLDELQEFQRGLLLVSSSETFSEGVSVLKSTVAQGSYAGSAALAVLYELSQGSAALEVSEVQQLAEGYLERNPEQSGLVRRELPQLFTE